MIQYKEELVKEILNAEQDKQTEVIDLSKKIFKNQYLSKDTCCCQKEKEIISMTFKNLKKSIRKHFKKIENSNFVFNLNIKVEEIIMILQMKIEENLCLINDLDALFNLLIIVNFEIDFISRMFFTELFCNHCI
ncbi:MAG: hypothetical protein ACK5XN_30180 [Bacteroidota bacterium]